MKKVYHESGAFHVSGEAIYIDDILINNQLLICKIVHSAYAHAKIKSFDLTKAKELSGIHAILSYKDLPAGNITGAIVQDELILAEDEVTFIGQGIFLIAAESKEIAIEAEKLIKIEYEPLEPIVTIEQAMAKGTKLHPTQTMECGDVEKAKKESQHIIEGEMRNGAQEQWYLETQISVAVPGEGDDMKVYSSTQHPSETQALVAEALGIKKMDVEVETRRMGGAFGGKESQANIIAIYAALLSQKTKQPVKLRLSREEDQIMTGKRHPFISKFKIGFNDDGIINFYEVDMHTNAGSSYDLTMPIVARALTHAENSYYIPNAKISATPWKTNIASNTAFRGFGGPQGMIGIEAAIDKIAYYLKKDASEIRYKNFYGIDDKNITPYGEIVENNRLYSIWDKLIKSSEYEKRKNEIDKFNKENEFFKKGIAITPVKFGISFNTAFLNQAGALVNIYTDGTVLVNHGGTEMGQGLHTKIRQIAALELGVNIQNIKVNATTTSKVPNTSATAASTGTDLNGMAVKNATEKLKKRIAQVIVNEFNKNKEHPISEIENIVFENDYIFDKINTERKISFVKALSIAYKSRISLSATGYYKTPNIHYDNDKQKGRPFHYYAFGMSVSEILLDTLTGYVKMLRTDILHDAGKSINKNIDIGQIEGGFVQGAGWCTIEECKWDKNGNLLNHSPDTYKIPGITDIPEDFRVNLLEDAPNPNTIRQSKAVGEPPFMLAFSVFFAIKNAIAAIANHAIEPNLNLPATNEKILLAIEELKNKIS